MLYTNMCSFLKATKDVRPSRYRPRSVDKRNGEGDTMRSRMNSSADAPRTRRERQTNAIEHAVVAAAVVVLVLSVLSSGTTRPSSVQTQLVTLESGDTLWALAASHPVRGLDTAQTAELIAELNGLTAGSLRQGSGVLVPVPSQPANALAMR